MHKVIQPKILYFGTPVILLSTINEDGTPNLAPISSVWWLGQTCMLGMSTRSKTVNNISRTRECVINIPSQDQVGAVDRLAMLTGRNPVPGYKQDMGYRFEPRKFEAAGLTPVPSDIVDAPRAAECPVQLEARISNIHPFGPEDDYLAGIEARIVRVHAEESILVPGKQNYIDPNRWKPIIMSFTEFYGIDQQVHPSRLAEAFKPYGDEELESLEQPHQTIDTDSRVPA